MQPLDRTWVAFRSIPLWGQVLLWLGLAPVLGALLILRRDPDATGNRALAAAVLVLGGALWLNVGDGEPANEPVAAESASADQEAVDEGETKGTPPSPQERPSPSPSPSPSPTSRPSPSPSPSPAPSPAPAVVAATWTVTNVVDGDTVDVSSADGTTERVRIIGIDTPERGDCGFGDASSALSSLVAGRTVQLVAGAVDDRDRYDRILRYVDVDGVDAGLELIERGLAIARYDSRDGYGAHPRERSYVSADDAAADITCAAPPPPAPAPAPEPEPAANCDPSYPTVCIPPSPPDLDCGEIPHRRFPVNPPDPHGFDGNDNDGLGCES